MRELEMKKAAEREEQLKAMAAYLKSIGVDSQVVEEAGADFFGESITEPVIHLKGQSIDKIRLLTTVYLSCGVVGSISRFAYEINLGDMPAQKLNGKMDARTEPVKENKFLGTFGGEVVGVKWAGSDLADRLNKDLDLSRALLECAGSFKSSEIEVHAQDQSTVGIIGPRFTESPELLKSEMPGKKTVLNDGDRLFGFEIYDIIARNIREVTVAG